jgi:hypothetical protein
VTYYAIYDGEKTESAVMTDDGMVFLLPNGDQVLSVMFDPDEGYFWNDCLYGSATVSVWYYPQDDSGDESTGDSKVYLFQNESFDFFERSDLTSVPGDAETLYCSIYDERGGYTKYGTANVTDEFVDFMDDNGDTILSYYSDGDMWQISNLDYDSYEPDADLFDPPLSVSVWTEGSNSGGDDSGDGRVYLFENEDIYGDGTHGLPAPIQGVTYYATCDDVATEPAVAEWGGNTIFTLPDGQRVLYANYDEADDCVWWQSANMGEYATYSVWYYP